MVVLAKSVMAGVGAECTEASPVGDSRRSHEIRIGMSLYWLQTWEGANGFAYSVSDMTGTARTREACVQMATERLRLREPERLRGVAT